MANRAKRKAPQSSKPADKPSPARLSHHRTQRRACRPRRTIQRVQHLRHGAVLVDALRAVSESQRARSRARAARLPTRTLRRAIPGRTAACRYTRKTRIQRTPLSSPRTRRGLAVGQPSRLRCVATSSSTRSAPSRGTSAWPTLHARPKDGRNRQRCAAAPPEPSHERVPGLALHGAKRGRVSTDTASGAPALDTHTNTAESSTAAAPITVSISTATALAVADPYANALDEPDEAPDVGHRERSTPENAARAAAASSTAPDVVMALCTPSPASSAIVDHSGPAPASASTTTGASSALGAAASKSDTIVANRTSRGDAGCPETPVFSRLSVPRSHVVTGTAAPAVLVAVQISVFAVGRRSSPISTAPPAPGATLAALLASATALHGSGASLASPAPAADAKTPNTLDTGSKSAVIVANATSRVHANCPRTPVVSRLPAPRLHVVPGTAVPTVSANAGTFSAFCIGRRSSAASAAPTVATPENAPVLTPAPALPPMPVTAMSPRLQPQSTPARFSVLRTVSRVIRRGVDAIRNALIALYTDGIGPTNANSSASPGLPDEGCWERDAPIDAPLLELRKRQRRRFL